MRTFDRENYKFRTYKNERYAMNIETKSSGNYAGIHTTYSNSYKKLYEKGKEEAKKGSRVEIWELKSEFIP